MSTEKQIEQFLSGYSEEVSAQAFKLRRLLLKNLPDIAEELDLPARMLAYAYGRKYAGLICVIIPSKKGLKPGFNRGVDLPDPDGLLEGAGKISRYVVIRSEKDIGAPAVKALLKEGLKAYRQRMKDL